MRNAKCEFGLAGLQSQTKSQFRISKLIKREFEIRKFENAPSD
jgi:hypothetical protein